MTVVILKMLDNVVTKNAPGFWLNLRNNAIKKTPTVFYGLHYLLFISNTIYYLNIILSVPTLFLNSVPTLVLCVFKRYFGFSFFLIYFRLITFLVLTF